jgi:hypothetical protein
VIVAINKRLQERLAKALAEEAGKASAGPATVTTAR